jgi:hypothetical protein
VWYFLTENIQSYFFQRNSDNRTLPQTDYELRIVFPADKPSRHIYSRFTIANDGRVLGPLHYFSAIVAPLFSGPNTAGFLSMGFECKGNMYTKIRTH